MRGGMLALGLMGCGLLVWSQGREEAEFAERGEFHFVRMEYKDLPFARRRFGGSGRGWWMQDWPEADAHFAQGVQRLTRIDIGRNEHHGLMSERVFDYPWMYATQVGYWDLSEREVERLREYLLRGGFLVVDDFYGPQDWEVFRQTMGRLFPGEPIEDLDPTDGMMHVLFDIKERTFIPGLRHLRRAGNGEIVVVQPGEPIWRAVHDGKGRMVVAVNFNMDVGDAWEHADMPEYPEAMTSLAYRFGINYIVYAMTH